MTNTWEAWAVDGDGTGAGEGTRLVVGDADCAAFGWTCAPHALRRQSDTARVETFTCLGHYDPKH